MTYVRRVFSSAILIAALVAGLMSVAQAAPAANEVLTWNETAVKAVAAGGQDPRQRTRTLVMVQGAVHDALNAITRRYAAYYFDGPGEAGAAPDAAVAAATHTVLVGVIPSFGTPAQKVAALALVEDAYMASMGRVSNGDAKAKGVAVGRAAGAAMLVLRKDDGATRDAPYTPGTGPGKWRPHPNPDPPNPPIANKDLAPGYEPSASTGWGNVAPFWFQGPPAWYSIACVVAQERGLDAWDSARALALMSLAMADGYIAGFKIRYVYDRWRPVTAIREGDADGNDATAGDPRWNSLQNTPAVSDYPSTQSTFSGAAAVALAGALGTDAIRFSFTSGPPFPDITRTFTSLSQAARESADSRVYAGIHFRSACEDGLVLGRQIGERTVALYLQPVKQ